MEPSIAQIPNQPTSKIQSQLFHFLLSRHPIPQLLIYHQARIQILTQIFQFFIPFHSLTTPTSKLPTDLQTPNHLPLPIPRQTLSAFSRPPFQPIQTSHPLPSLSTPTYATHVTPTYSPFTSERSIINSPDTIQISVELDIFITLQHRLTYPRTLTIHQLSSTATSSNQPTPSPLSDYTPSLAQSSTTAETSTSTNRAYRTIKQKFSNNPFTTKPGTAKEYINHPEHTNTKNFLQITLPSFPQNTFNTSTTTNDTQNFVDEHFLIPTLHWTAYYNSTNPLFLPLTNTHEDNERNKNILFILTTPLTPR